MVKEQMKPRFGIFQRQQALARAVRAAVFVLLLSFFMPAEAQAQCETAGPANAALARLISADLAAANAFLDREENYIQYEAMRDRLYFEVSDRFQDEFSKPILIWLNNWWANQFRPTLKKMMAELHVSVVDQTQQIGFLTDAQISIDDSNAAADTFLNQRRKYAPSTTACEVDEVWPSLSQTYQISRAFNHGLTKDATPRHANAKDTLSDSGQAEEGEALFLIYAGFLCDKDMGDQGCENFPGGFGAAILQRYFGTLPILKTSMKGRHKDIAKMLWGSKQTMDPSDFSTIWSIQTSLDFMIYPFSPYPIPPTAVDTVAGRYAMLGRRSQLAYINTIFNVMGSMLSERIGGYDNVGKNLKSWYLRQAPNAQGDPTRADRSFDELKNSMNPSYREAQEAMTKDRFNNPQYLLKMIEDPDQVSREQITVNALRLQTMHDIYRRSEEMLAMEAAGYARDLFKFIPSRDRALIGVKIR